MSSTAIFVHKDLIKKKTVFPGKSFCPSSLALWIILKSISLFSPLQRKLVKSCGTFTSGLVLAYRSLTPLAWRSQYTPQFIQHCIREERGLHSR